MVLYEKEDSGVIDSAMYETSRAVKTANGRWSLFLDYYGTTDAEGHGYVLLSQIHLLADISFVVVNYFPCHKVINVAINPYYEIH